MLAVGLVQLCFLLAALLDLGTALAVAIHLPVEVGTPWLLGRVAVGAWVTLAVWRLVVTLGLSRRARWSRPGAIAAALLGAADLPHGPLVALVTLAVLAGRAGEAWFTPPPAPRPEGYGLPRNAFAPPPPPPAPRVAPWLALLAATSLGLGAAAACAGPALLQRAGAGTRADEPLRSRLVALLDLRGLCWPAGLVERLTLERAGAGVPPGAGGEAPPGAGGEPARAPDGTPLDAEGKPTLAKPAHAVPGLPGYYRYTDDAGTAHLTPDFDSIPERYRY